MNEYIKRQDAIDAIKSVPTGNWSSKRYAGEIEKIPSADVKPAVRGKWEKDSDGVPHCTNCDSLAPQKLVLHIKTISCTAPFVQSKFCPNCGSYNGGDAK